MAVLKAREILKKSFAGRLQKGCYYNEEKKLIWIYCSGVRFSGFPRVLTPPRIICGINFDFGKITYLFLISYFTR
jgi:hypothetical protein